MPQMNEGVDRYTPRFFTKTSGKGKQTLRKQDYRTKLWNTPVDGAGDVENDVECPYADRIRNIVASLQSSVACQSVAVAAFQTLDRVLHRERLAENAAISLAQGEKLNQMIQMSEAALEAISDALNAQGNHMVNLTVDADLNPPEENSWWFALTEVIESIENGTQRMLSLASGQPKGGAARKLSTIVVQLLRGKHQQLLTEADAWIS